MDIYKKKPKYLRNVQKNKNFLQDLYFANDVLGPISWTKKFASWHTSLKYLKSICGSF